MWQKVFVWHLAGFDWQFDSKQKDTFRVFRSRQINVNRKINQTVLLGTSHLSAAYMRCSQLFPLAYCACKLIDLPSIMYLIWAFFVRLNAATPC